MPHFKNQKNELFWLDDQDVTFWKKPEWQEISDTEAENIRVANSPAPDRKTESLLRLSAIDKESIRPARAVAYALAAGLPVPEFDAGKLAALETEAAALRAELAAMGTV